MSARRRVKRFSIALETFRLRNPPVHQNSWATRHLTSSRYHKGFNFNDFSAQGAACNTALLSIGIAYYDAASLLFQEGEAMQRARVRVSPKFQIVIPKSIREELHIEAGQDLVMYSLEGTIRILPRRSVKELRGSAKGMRWKEDYRDHSDHF
jgi:AbrB family looped-hinge helix DNA binding protein